jgi:hypothetical protein
MLAVELLLAAQPTARPPVNSNKQMQTTKFGTAKLDHEVKIMQASFCSRFGVE